MTSLLSTSENKENSVSFRSIMLIMIYAGTILLNLLAASMDDRFTMRKYQSQDNSTMSLMEMDAIENADTVNWSFKRMKIFLYFFFFNSFVFFAGSEWRNGLFMEYIINRSKQWCYCWLADDFIDEYKLIVRYVGRNGQISHYKSLKMMRILSSKHLHTYTRSF